MLSWRTKLGSSTTVKQHIGDAQHVRKLFLFHGAYCGLHLPFVRGLLDVTLAHVAQRAGQETASAAGRVEKALARFGVDAVDHEGGDCTGRVVLARIACGLQVVEDLFIDVTEVLACCKVVEIDVVDLVDHLTHQLAGLHVVVRVFEHVAYDAAAVTGLPGSPGSVSGSGTGRY